MRRLIAVLVLLLAAAGLAFWLSGGAEGLARLAAGAQREVQAAMAGVLRRLKAGEAGAVLTLIGLAFGYGVVHAAGPGHGKVLIGGYALGSRMRLAPLLALALASSLAQATVAVVLVYAGVMVFDWTREQMVGAADRALALASHAAIGAIGLWLFWRGARRLLARGHGHAHAHDHAAECGCGHAHGPAPEDLARVRGWRDAAVLVAGVAMRPCTGALFLLILTWRMGLDLAGIAGAYAMGLGTATVTVAVVLASVGMRESALAAMGRSRALAVGIPALELVAGGLIAIVAAGLIRPLL